MKELIGGENKTFNMEGTRQKRSQKAKAKSKSEAETTFH
jgi:hypothetical protein